MIESEAKKNQIEHNEEILREIWNKNSKHNSYMPSHICVAFVYR